MVEWRWSVKGASCLALLQVSEQEDNHADWAMNAACAERGNTNQWMMVKYMSHFLMSYHRMATLHYDYHPRNIAAGDVVDYMKDEAADFVPIHMARSLPRQSQPLPIDHPFRRLRCRH